MLVLLIALLVTDVSWSAREVGSLAQVVSTSCEIPHLAMNLSLLPAGSQTQLVYLVILLLLHTASSHATVGNWSSVSRHVISGLIVLSLLAELEMVDCTPMQADENLWSGKGITDIKT